MKKLDLTYEQLEFSKMMVPKVSTLEEANRDLEMRHEGPHISSFVAYFGTKLLVILVYALILFLVGCQSPENKAEGTQKTPDSPVIPAPEVPKSSNPVSIGAEVALTNGKPGVVLYPTVETSGSIPWVWYAPAFLDSKDQPLPIEIQWMANQLRSKGIAFVVANIGESFGAPFGRELFEEFYSHFNELGLQTQGCMILQSRGGLMGYTWQLDHPGRVKCNLGFYPLLSFDDYIGTAGFAPFWGVNQQWMIDHKAEHEPLARASQLTIPILHIHGDSDPAVHLEYDRQFLSQYGGPRWGMQLLEVNDLGHTYTKEMFENPYALEFLTKNLF